MALEMKTIAAAGKVSEYHITGTEKIQLTLMNATADSHFSGQKVEVNGVELYYVQRGSGPHAVLCIPGALAPCEWSFASQLEHFGRENSDYKIIAFDPRGYGYSRPYDRKFTFKDGEHHLKTDAIDAYHLMKKLGFSTFSVLGWCDGGVTGIFLASLFPSAVVKLVLWGSRTYITEHDLKISEQLESIDGWGAKFLKAFVPVYGSVTELLAVYNPLADAMRAFCTFKKDGDICTKEMSSITCPTLILHGEMDAFTAVCHAKHMNTNIKESKLHIFNGGKHNLQMGKIQTLFNTVVETFLQTDSKQLCSGI